MKSRKTNQNIHITSTVMLESFISKHYSNQIVSLCIQFNMKWWVLFDFNYFISNWPKRQGSFGLNLQFSTHLTETNINKILFFLTHNNLETLQPCHTSLDELPKHDSLLPWLLHYHLARLASFWLSIVCIVN